MRRVLHENDDKHCNLIMGKARVAPRKFVSITRLELVAAVLSVKILNKIKKKLELQNFDEYFRTDTGYFRSPLGSRLCWGTLPMSIEHSRSSLQTESQRYRQWKYILSKENHTNEASRYEF